MTDYSKNGALFAVLLPRLLAGEPTAYALLGVLGIGTAAQLIRDQLKKHT